MKFKIALIAVLAAGLTASFAVAAPAKKKPGGNTTTNTTTTKGKAKGKTKKVCSANVSLILKGTLVSIVNETSFKMDVKQTNKHAKAYKGQTGFTVLVDSKTKILRKGKRVALSALDDLSVNDYRLNVRARFCKKLTGAPAPPLAVRVVAKPIAKS
jgi:hypothetical protein